MSNSGHLDELPPSAACLGCKFVDFDEEERSVRVSCHAGPQFASQSGFIQGGFLVAMLDEAMGYALTAESTGKLAATTISIATDFLRPALPGRILAHAKITLLGKTIVFLEAALFDEAGKAIARATSSCKLIR